MHARTVKIAGVVVALAAAGPVHGQSGPGYNTYGAPGLIDMPSALMRPDGELAFTSSHFRNQTRNTLTFQFAPRLTGSFRYSPLYDIRGGGPSGTGDVFDFIFDRSFSLQYQLFDETDRRPALAIGLNDFLGTGIYSSEYLVATKTFGDRFRVTGGIGWGRLGSANGFDNPLGVFSDELKDRDDVEFRGGGEVSNVALFSGDAAFFGGVEYRLNDRTWLIAEYSSDDYAPEDGTAFDQKTQYNFGISYQANDYINIAANYLYGSEFGIRATFALNPQNRPSGSGRDPGPPPVRPVPASSPPPGLPASVIQSTEAALAAEGLGLHGIALQGDRVTVEIENTRYSATAQAIGRTARVLTQTMPAGVGTFTVTPINRGIRGTSATIARGTMERYEFELDQTWESYARTRFDEGPDPLAPLPGRYPAFSYSIAPYLAEALFDPDDPLRVDVGVSLLASYEPAPGLIVSGEVRQRLFGNRDESTRESTSVLPRVRSESNIYQREGETTLHRLYGAYYFQPGETVSARITAGYLEPQFAGVSAEVLWSPPASRLSYGVEINYAQQRAFEQDFDLRDYDIVTGHASVYYDMGNGYFAQVDAGRYLAGDWGGTLSVERRFDNGWEIGAFATLTDVPFEDFGEGSFDKGILLTIPVDWITGQPSRDTINRTIRPVQRDGGARLSVPGRLYGIYADQSVEDYTADWGRFWR
ncbi:YjbH domain-containing protein [Histidinibacterium lentulum]|uniref:YjbH domain-containing protein n=1 Tax=Histidinibacterium lentulum TaxID=2480588 RepID=A0A3N2QSB5_9RHOB|nr:YjbH domain-containing protein [Histidinibacterium lentulum]ROT98106.1 YjbH domain-containing protein [Histidinibacterium lentulum]